MDRQNEAHIVDLPRVSGNGQRSQQTYEEYTTSNRRIVIDIFSTRAQLSNITIEDLANIQSSQILLNLTAPSFLNALENNCFTIHDITNMLSAFCTYLLAAPRTRTGNSLIDAMPPEGIHLMAEQNMGAFMEEIVKASHLESLNTGRYTMEFLCDLAQEHGPIAPNLLDALDEERVTMAEIETMTPEELETAISENHYPNTGFGGPE
ncbi:MAG: hypothetical protein NXI01_01545 [Gammaproteobacteria bacterium]|nr:hypothetical protein [Gammaproteobacteria bacterium]